MKKNLSAYKENWPSHYYEITDVNDREEVLKEVLAENPDSREDQRRLEILHLRYGKAPLKNRPDHFMHALLMIREMADQKVNRLNEKKKEEEFATYLEELSAYDEADKILEGEYRDLIQRYIEVSRKSFSRPAFLGMGKRSEEKVSDVMEKELNIIFEEVPKQFHREKEFASLKKIADEIVQESK